MNTFNYRGMISIHETWTQGDTHVEYQTNGGQGDIKTPDNTLVIKDTGDRDNRWIKGFSVAGPSIIDTPLLTNDVDFVVLTLLPHLQMPSLSKKSSGLSTALNTGWCD